MSGRSAVFLDRDGVINDLVLDPLTGHQESPYRPEDVRIPPGVPEELESLASGGFVLVVVSNQPAAAKGIATNADLDAVHARIVELLGEPASAVSDWRYCRHHPEALDPARRRCDCRKPKPGLLLAAARDLRLDLARSWMIGDADRDIEAGAAAGCETILVENPASAWRRTGAARPNFTVGDLRLASETISERRRYALARDVGQE